MLLFHLKISFCSHDICLEVFESLVFSVMYQNGLIKKVGLFSNFMMLTNNCNAYIAQYVEK